MQSSLSAANIISLPVRSAGLFDYYSESNMKEEYRPYSKVQNVRWPRPRVSH